MFFILVPFPISSLQIGDGEGLGLGATYISKSLSLWSNIMVYNLKLLYLWVRVAVLKIHVARSLWSTMAPHVLVERTSTAGVSVFSHTSFLNGVITVNKGGRCFTTVQLYLGSMFVSTRYCVVWLHETSYCECISEKDHWSTKLDTSIEEPF